MDILQAIMGAADGGAVKQIARQFGLQEDQAASAIQTLLPALMGGVNNNIQQGGMDALMGALTKGNHSRYIEDPELLSSPDTVDEGNGILGHLLGSKDASRQVASHAAEQTGIGADILKRMLPMVATMAMGAMAKGSVQQGIGQAAASSGGGLMGMLTPFLDSNRDGSIADDVLGMMGNMLRRS